MDPMRLPFVFRSPDILTYEEREEKIREIAEQFLGMLADTSPGHRDDYGDVLRTRLTGLIQIGWEFEYSGWIEIERT